MGIYSIKPKFQKFLSPVTNFFIRYRISPNTINMMGLILSVVTGVFLYLSPSHSSLLLWVPVLVFVRTAFNALDGLVSRSLGIASRFGEVLNEFLDRLSDSAIFFGLALASFSNLALGSLTVVAILLNSYLSIVSKTAGGSRQYGGVMGKADRMIYLGAMALIVYGSGNVAWWNYFFVFILVGTVITLVQRFMATKNELK